LSFSPIIDFSVSTVRFRVVLEDWSVEVVVVVFPVASVLDVWLFLLRVDVPV